MPNYAARRMLFGAIVIAIVFAGGVLVWRLVDGGDTATGRDLPTWSAIAFADRTSGDITYVRPDGELIGVSTGHGRATGIHGIDGVVTLSNRDELTVVPGAEAGDASDDLVVPIPSGAVTTPVRTGSGTVLAVGTSTGGDVLLVDPGDASVIDIGERAAASLPSEPRMFVETLQTDADGTVFAIADASNFQTILVRTDRTDPSFFPDQPIAVGKDRIATSQTVGLQADLTLSDFDRVEKASVPADIPAGAIIDGEQLLFVSTSGGVFRVRDGADRPERIGTIALPAGAQVQWARPTADLTRLVVAGATFEAVIDLDGTTVFSAVFTSAVDVVQPSPTWTCLPVGGDGGAHSIIDLETGEPLADLAGASITQVSADGCAVIATRDGGTELVTDAGAVSLDTIGTAVSTTSVVTTTTTTTTTTTVDPTTGATTAPGSTTSVATTVTTTTAPTRADPATTGSDELLLAPDGRSVLVRSSAGTTSLVPTDDRDGELTLGDPIDLSAYATRLSLVTFVAD